MREIFPVVTGDGGSKGHVAHLSDVLEDRSGINLLRVRAVHCRVGRGEI